MSVPLAHRAQFGFRFHSRAGPRGMKSRRRFRSTRAAAPQPQRLRAESSRIAALPRSRVTISSIVMRVVHHFAGYRPSTLPRRIAPSSRRRRALRSHHHLRAVHQYAADILSSICINGKYISAWSGRVLSSRLQCFTWPTTPTISGETVAACRYSRRFPIGSCPPKILLRK